MFRLVFKADSNKVLAERLMTLGSRLIDNLVETLNRNLIKLQMHIVGDKLQGQVLTHRSGQLSASIRVVPATLQDGLITGEVQGAGGTAWYGRLQEEGVPHSWTIVPSSKKALHFMMGGASVFAKKVTHPGLKPRSFMVSALDDLRDDILSDLQNTVDVTMGGTK